jgi:class 3 adenylate cyclase/ABC-type transport system substrate-binding protein/streptogramin lyase
VIDMAMSHDVPIGTSLAGYRVERLLGRGAMGGVYLARDEHLDRLVAVKLVASGLSDDERFRSRFLRESRLAAALDHPAVVPIYGAGEADGLLYLAMRYVPGGDLRGVLRGHGVLAPERALTILEQIGGALDAAHERGLVHRDVKPGNILLDAGDRAYLADFGLAKHAATVNSLSREGVFSGTIDYVAPEQIQGRDVDGRTDVYALACVLFECLAGRPPYQRETDLAVVFAHLSDAAPALSALRPELPASLDAVLARGLAKDPDDRYPAASQLIADARAAIGGAEPAPAGGATQLRTFMIADVRGYTRYTQQHGDEAGAALASAFAELVRGVVSRHDGRLIELRGDEALVVFTSARNALMAALALQAEVAEQGLPRGVGVGLDAGEAVPVGKGYRGGALNMAARLCSIAQPGEVLASEALIHLARTIPGVRYLEGRLERLKGIDHPVRVVEVVPQERTVARLRALSRRLRGRRWPVAVAGGAVIVAALAGAALLLTRGSAETELSSLRTVAAFAADGKLAASVPTGVDTFDAKPLDGFVWVLESGGSLVKIDPRRNKIVQAVPVGPDAGWAAGGGAVWVVDADAPAVIRVDAQYGTTTRLRLPRVDDGTRPAGDGIAYGAGSIWVGQGQRVLRLDPSSGRVERSIPAPQLFAVRTAMAFGDGVLYVANQVNGDFFKVDPASNSVQWQSHLHPWLSSLLAAGGSLWVTVDSDAGVYRFNASDGSQTGFVHTGEGSGGIAWDDGTLWVSNWRGGTVTKVDPVGMRGHSFPTGNAPNGVAALDGRLWVTLAARPPDYATTVKGDVARFVMREDWLDQGDPATAWSQRPWELEYATEAKLYNYPDYGSAEPATVVPEIAAARPAVEHTGDVWTSTIPIRAGYGFSPPSGEPVTAASMRYTIERALSPQLGDGFQPASLFLSNLVGEDAFRAGKADHIAGLAVRGRSLVLRTTAPVPDLPERLALPFFSAVPLGTPIAGLDVQAHPIPTAGPYYISYQNTGWQTVVRRNPSYRGPRPHRLDAVVYVSGIDTGPAAARVVRGELDYEAESFPDYGALAPGGDIARRFETSDPNRPDGRPHYVDVHLPGIRWLNLNTTSGPLSDLDARRAINLVIDRPALAAADGGAPSDHYLPPPMMGPEAARHVYPVGRPDVARARALWHGRARRLVLLNCKQPACRDQGNILRANLAQIGVQLAVRAVDDPFSMPAKGVDMRMSNWFVDEYDPANVLGGGDAPEAVLFADDPGLNPFGSHDSALARQADAASTLSGAARQRAYQALAVAAAGKWAPWAVFEQAAQPSFFSARLGCISSSPAYHGIDIARLCLR